MSFGINIFWLFPSVDSAKGQTQHGSEQQGPGGEETLSNWKKKRRPYESIVTIIYATQVGSLEKIKEEKLKQMLEYNITLMNLQRESDKYLAKIQSNKVGKKHPINLRNCSQSLSRDNNPTWRRGERRKGLQLNLSISQYSWFSFRIEISKIKLAVENMFNYVRNFKFENSQFLSYNVFVHTFQYDFGWLIWRTL